MTLKELLGKIDNEQQLAAFFGESFKLSGNTESICEVVAADYLQCEVAEVGSENDVLMIWMEEAEIHGL